MILAAAPAWGIDFPPITEKERNLTEVPGAPGAAAVFLDSSAELWFRDFRNLGVSSTLRVTARLKVLTPEGVESYGEIPIRTPMTRVPRYLEIPEKPLDLSGFGLHPAGGRNQMRAIRRRDKHRSWW